MLWASEGQKCSGLHAWLLRRGQAAAVDSLDVTKCGSTSGQQMQLPVQQLTALRNLQLSGLQVVFTKDTAGQQVRTAALPPELSALTHLNLFRCPMELDALPVFTQLQRLCLACGNDDSVLQGNVAALASAIPSMQPLSHLDLVGSLTQDAVLNGVQHLPCPVCRCCCCMAANAPVMHWQSCHSHSHG